MEVITLTDSEWSIVVMALRYKAEMDKARATELCSPVIQPGSQIEMLAKTFEQQATTVLNLASEIENGARTVDLVPASRANPLDRSILPAIEALASRGLDCLANEATTSDDFDQKAYSQSNAALAAFRKWSGVNADLAEA